MSPIDIDQIGMLDRAQRNDPRFDGQFYSAVLTTGIFCRPGCPGKPRAENVRFFSTAAAAAEAGFRPCLRCHPESAPDAPEWNRTSPVVSRALRLIGEGLLDDGTVHDLADRLRVSPRQLQRLFVEELGAPPVAVAQTRRLLFAKKLIDETDLTMAEIAFSAGYSSVRRFNEALKQTYARTPSELRRTRRRAHAYPSSAAIELKLFYREPYNWSATLAFLTEHGTPLVERVDRTVYQRAIQVGGIPGVISVRPLNSQRALLLRVPTTMSRYLLPISERIKQMFDLKADPIAIASDLSAEPQLASTIETHAGVRLPGCWDGLEVAAGAILEATAPGCGRHLTASLVTTFGEPLADSPDPSLTYLFPSAERLSQERLEEAGLDLSQACIVQSLATAVLQGQVNLSAAESRDCLTQQLAAIPGIDGDVSRYMALRLLGDPDLDLSENRILFGTGIPSETNHSAGMTDHPGRSYAAMYRWTALHSRSAVDD